MDRKKTIQVFEDMKRGLYPMYPDEYLDAAIEALSAEPCEDAISRQAVLDLIYNSWKHNGVGENYGELSIDALKALPPVTPKQKMGRWIPVSERLPEKEGRYLTTIFNGIQYIMTCDYHPYSRCWFPDDECASDNVIAWMPLPEPYKAESED